MTESGQQPDADTTPHPPALPARAPTSGDPAWVRILITTIAVGSLIVLVVIPVLSVFVEALSRGVTRYAQNLTDPDNLSAIALTAVVAPCAVILNTLFGVAAAWAIARFQFPGRTLLVTFIDLPFAISPVVAGLMFVLLFGSSGWFGPWLNAHGLRLLFTPLALVIATTFVTLPFVARELIPVMEAIGPDEELAALSLGANGRQIFWRITLPNVKWGLLYGLILCNARAMGEFGAVYVVGGRIAGETNTMPLQVEMLFQGFDSPAAFAVATVLTMLGLVSLGLKTWVESQQDDGQKQEEPAEPGITESVIPPKTA
ncbi:MAG: sulfate ABC transporter permease subunit CysW [Bacteroidales bacterium]|nr:sulfate ABC transporter permease subunit CysW [Bacteroidales bacterium]